MPKDEYQFGRIKDAKKRAEAEKCRVAALKDAKRGIVGRPNRHAVPSTHWSDGPLGKGVAVPRIVMPFGKHAGKPVSKLPPKYVLWLASLPIRNDALKRAIIQRIASENIARKPRRRRRVGGESPSP